MSDLEISSCEVSISGRFAKPLTFSCWPPPLGDLEISRRGKSGRKCRLEISEKSISYAEDGRTEQLDARKRKIKKLDEDLEILGLGSHPSSEEEISRAYRKAALLHHPDKSGGADGKFLRLSKAKNTLLAKIKK